MREREGKALRLVNITKQQIPHMMLMAAAQMLEDYANENISEELDAFGQFMYHAQLLRNNHLDVYLMDLHLVDQPYRDILVMVFHELSMEDDESETDPSEIDNEDSDEDTPA
jgi:hypothetical protein